MGPWRDPSGFFAQTTALPDAAQLPLIFSKYRLHLGFPIALLIAVAVYVLLFKTPLGFEIRAIGSNRTAAKFQGLNAERLIVLVMLLSGALAGLAGGTELIGLHHRLRMDISVGYGFTGIIIALLGRLHPAGTVLAAIFFGALVNGANPHPGRDGRARRTDRRDPGHRAPLSADQRRLVPLPDQEDARCPITQCKGLS